MIKRVIKMATGSYLINDVLIIKIKEDSTLDISYDIKDLDFDAAHDLIHEFLNPEEGELCS